MLSSFCKKMFRRNSFLLNLMISILGLICVPLIAVQIFTVIRSGNEFDREIREHYRGTLKSLASSFEDQLQNISVASTNIKYNDELMQPLLNHIVGYDLSVVAQTMTRYGTTVAFTDSVGIFYPNRQMCLHSHYKYSLERISEQYFPAGSEGALALEEYIRNADTLSLFYTGSYEDSLMNRLFVARSVRYNDSRNRQIVVFFTISDSTLLDWCSIFIPFSTGIAITDRDDNYVMRTADFTPELLASAEYQAFLADPTAITFEPEWLDTLVFCKYTDTVHGRTFVVSMLRDKMQESVNGYTDQTADLLISTVVLMILLLAATLYINYRPIFRIVSKHIQRAPGNEKLSDLELIDSHFFALDRQINDQENLLATFTMSDLLSGIRVQRETAQQYFPREVFRQFVAATAFANLTSTQTNQVCGSFEEAVEGKLIITSVPYRPETVFVYCAPEEIRQPQLQAALGAALEEAGVKVENIHFGMPVSDVTQIQASYSDSLPAERLAVLPQRESEEANTDGLIREFIVQVSAGSEEKALAALDKLESECANLKPSVRRFVNQKLLYRYLTEVQKNGTSLRDEDVDRLLDFPNGAVLFKMLRALVVELKKREDSQKPPEPDQMEQLLLDFVDERYLDSSLCLSAAADYLQTSIYTVSRIFKERTGMGFKEYITGKRLRQACRLLRTTNLPVTTIAAQCGFENANYFTVVFRTEYGIPPSKYRAGAAENSGSQRKEE